MILVVVLFFGGSFFVVVVFLGCYVVKLAKAKKGKDKKQPPKSGSTSVHFEHGQSCLHVQ